MSNTTLRGWEGGFESSQQAMASVTYIFFTALTVIKFRFTGHKPLIFLCSLTKKVVLFKLKMNLKKKIISGMLNELYFLLRHESKEESLGKY